MLTMALSRSWPDTPSTWSKRASAFFACTPPGKPFQSLLLKSLCPVCGFQVVAGMSHLQVSYAFRIDSIPFTRTKKPAMRKSAADLPKRDRSIDGLIALVAYFLPSNFFLASGVTGVNKLTRLPSGSRNKRDLLPQGIVVGFCTRQVGRIAASRS